MAEPRCTVDIIIHDPGDRVLLVERANPPHGWALPGGFVDPGEALDGAARREAREETGLELEELFQFATYSAPERDPRGHTISTVYVARPAGEARAASDAASLDWFPLADPPETAFDHGAILADYRRFLETGERPRLP
ncbi:NUDIX hydrolase [Thiohalorhabdus denitrificans]|uniref:8-oxo-dGTP diphosphatase n=1 Tax=Thiohalorhabdus denitrificans TaxID=381306 RepID=A0A0N8PMS5_9GAMM|nr:NUDIX hydrolase [Thiohalorhabdus denitrificans]KPV39541.1 NUDIX hydrolase [Thiohalorhabdus denitrificans]SCX99279.1 8-oxo-dGTP diphosphatase [Thiohalorhabdus denitrificans]